MGEFITLCILIDSSNWLDILNLVHIKELQVIIQFNPYTPSILFLGYKQTVQTKISSILSGFYCLLTEYSIEI